jgi:hypothetical protein
MRRLSSLLPVESSLLYMTTVNDSAVVAEVTDLYLKYE